MPLFIIMSYDDAAILTKSFGRELYVLVLKVKKKCGDSGSLVPVQMR